MQHTKRGIMARATPKRTFNKRTTMPFFYLLTLLLLSNNFTAVGQIKEPERPKFANEPTTITQTNNNSTAKLGMHSDDVINQVNRNTRRMMGIPEPITQEDIQKGLYQKQLDNARLEKQRMLDEILKEGKTYYPTLKEKEIPTRFRLVDTSNIEYKKNQKFYQATFRLLGEMLEGRQPLDLKRAVFFTEKASDPLLDWKKFEADISYWKAIVLQLVKQENLDPNNSLSINFCIQKLYSDTINITDPTTNKKKTFQPLTYDFEDIYGDENIHQNMVTKLLRTHKGQCHSMPLLYLILAKELGAEAYIAYSPNHSFIMFPDSYGKLSCYETTSGYNASRDMYLESSFIKSEALKNKIFLNPTTLKETIASCLNTLSFYYQQQFGNDDFVLQCTQLARKHFPNSVLSQVLAENIGTAYLLAEAKRCGWPDVNQKHKYPRLSELHGIMVDLQTQTDLMGYEEMPKEAYERWLRSVEAEKQKRKTK